MKSTGLVRLIDDLGRVVIPKEIRQKVHIRENDPLEISIDPNGKIVIEKYSIMEDIAAIASDYARSLQEEVDGTVLITDNDRVIVAAGSQSRYYQRKALSSDLSPHIKCVEPSIVNIPIIADDPFAENAKIFCSILSSNKPVGYIIVLADSDEIKREKAIKIRGLLRVATDFLRKQFI